MDYIIISVPDLNDSVSRVVLNGTVYQIRFTWNDTEQRWYFSLATSQNAPIVQMVKIIPGFPLNLFLGRDDMPNGIFGVLTNLDAVGRKDFIDGKAQFFFAPAPGVG